MARIYGVLSASEGVSVKRRSLTGDEFVKADIAVTWPDGTEETWRLEVVADYGVTIESIGKRWDAAQASPQSEWQLEMDKLLPGVDDPDEEIGG